MPAIELPTCLEHWPIERVLPCKSNPRTHSPEQIAKLVASMREFGWTNPVLVDGDDTVIAGHGRLLAARELGLTEVPVIQLRHLTEAQRCALMIADNRLAQDAGWDSQLLEQELEKLRGLDYDLTYTGFELDELQRYLEHGGEPPPGAPQLSGEPVSEPGDVWHLEEALLLCGSPLDHQELLGSLVAGNSGCDSFAVIGDRAVCDQIVRNWQRQADADAVLADGGTSFRNVATERGRAWSE